MIDVSYKSILLSIGIISLFLLIVCILTIININKFDYSNEVKDIINKISKLSEIKNICNNSNKQYDYKLLCELQSNLDFVDNNRKKLKQDLLHFFIASICCIFLGFDPDFIFMYVQNNSKNKKKNNEKEDFNSKYFKIFCLIICISGIIKIINFYKKIKKTKEELKLSKEIIEYYNNIPIHTGKEEEKDRFMKSFNELIIILKKYNKELESFILYNNVILVIMIAFLLMFTIYTIKLLLNHKK